MDEHSYTKYPFGGLLNIPEQAEKPEPTGKVYIVMKSIITKKTYVKQYKTLDGWLELTPFTDISGCWAFSKQGAKKIIERFKTKTYKANYDKGLVDFDIMDEYSY